MQKDLEKLKPVLGSRSKIFERLNSLILGMSKKIEFRVFPIYISYSIGDSNLVIIYFRGKLIQSTEELLLGLNFKKPSAKITGFEKADYMKFPGITHAIKIDSLVAINKNFIDTIKSELSI